MSSFVAFLSGADQYGRWVPSEEVTASAYLGGSTVDFSQALFKHPVITIRSTAFWGSVTLIVPPNVAVEQDGSAILGGFGEAGGVWSNHNTVGASQSAAPVTLRVVGTALMGRVNAVVNHRAKPAVLLSAEEVERILREVPPEPSTTVQDFMAHAMQAQLQAQQAQQAQQAALAQAFAQAAAGATNPMTPGMMPPGVAPGVSPGVAPGVAPGMPMTPGVVPMTGVPVGADPRQALLQGLVTAQAQSGDPRAAVLQQVLNAHTAQAAAQAAYTPQMPLPTAPSQTVQGLQGQPVAQPVAAGGLQSMD